MLPRIRCTLTEIAHSCKRPTLLHATRTMATNSFEEDFEEIFRAEAVPISSLPPSLRPTQAALAAYSNANALKLAAKPIDIPPDSDPLLTYLASRIMVDGKKHAAERRVSRMLLYIFALTRSPPLPIFRRAVELAAPSIRILSHKAGGGKRVDKPFPLSEKQRTWYAIKWILEASDLRKTPGQKIEERLARTVLNIVRSDYPTSHGGSTEGMHEVLRKKWQVHHTAMVNRANVPKA